MNTTVLNIKGKDYTCTNCRLYRYKSVNYMVFTEGDMWTYHDGDGVGLHWKPTNRTISTGIDIWDQVMVEPKVLGDRQMLKYVIMCPEEDDDGEMPIGAILKHYPKAAKRRDKAIEIVNRMFLFDVLAHGDEKMAEVLSGYSPTYYLACIK